MQRITIDETAIQSPVVGSSFSDEDAYQMVDEAIRNYRRNAGWSGKRPAVAGGRVALQSAIRSRLGRFGIRYLIIYSLDGAYIWLRILRVP